MTCSWLAIYISEIWGTKQMPGKQMLRKLMRPKRLTPWRKRYGIQLNGILHHGTHWHVWFSHRSCNSWSNISTSLCLGLTTHDRYDSHIGRQRSLLRRRPLKMSRQLPPKKPKKASFGCTEMHGAEGLRPQVAHVQPFLAKSFWNLPGLSTLLWRRGRSPCRICRCRPGCRRESGRHGRSASSWRWVPLSFLPSVCLWCWGMFGALISFLMRMGPELGMEPGVLAFCCWVSQLFQYVGAFKPWGCPNQNGR